VDWPHPKRGASHAPTMKNYKIIQQNPDFRHCRQGLRPNRKGKPSGFVTNIYKRYIFISKFYYYYILPSQRNAQLP